MKPYTLSCGALSARFDPDKGVLLSLRERDTFRALEYMGNPENLRYPEFHQHPQWTGDLRLRIYHGAGWNLEETAASDDCRRVFQEGDRVTVCYDGPSGLPGGLRTLRIRSDFEGAQDGLHWMVHIRNSTDALLEVGEVSLPFIANIDYTSIFTELLRDSPEDIWRGERQRIWHEERVLMHQSICGHGSYVLLQRPAGDGPALLFAPEGDTALELSYLFDRRIGSQSKGLTFEGPYFLSAYAHGATQAEDFFHPIDVERLWFNRPSSLLLGPGEEKVLRFRFQLVEDAGHMQEALYRLGHPAIEMQPGANVHMAQPLHLAVRLSEELRLIRESNGITIEPLGAEGAWHRYRIEFSSAGQKKIRLEYSDGRWMNLFFWALRDSEEALKRHADFVYRNQFCDIEEDPFHRYHAYLALDDSLEELYLRSYAHFQACGTDEFCAVVGMQMAEKNALYPDRTQVEQLEHYIDDFLLRHMQDPQTFAIYKTLYWDEPVPSTDGRIFTEADTHDIRRAPNYPLHVCIYHSLYRIAKLYGLTRRHTATEYLYFAYRTCMLWFDMGVGNRNLMGAPAGSILLDLLQSLQEDAPEEFAALDARVLEVACINAQSVYPYGSELYTDQTAHDQLHALYQYAGLDDKRVEALQVTRALRCGDQAAWYLYGNEKRGNACNWYGTGCNSRIFLEEYLRGGDQQLLRWGVGGMLSQMINIKENGVVRGWFCWWPDRFGFSLRTLDSDMGVHAYLKHMRSFVEVDPRFGLCGYACRVEERDGAIVAEPLDGVRRRLSMRPFGLHVELLTGEIASCLLRPAQRLVTLALQDSTGLVPRCSGVICFDEQTRPIDVPAGTELTLDFS